MIGDTTGKPRYDFSGKLSFHWPADCAAGAPALFGLGYGGTYAAPVAAPPMATSCAGVDGATSRTLYARGPASGILLNATDAAGERALPGWKGTSSASAVTLSPFDLTAQEDARTITWSAPASLSIPLGSPVAPKGSVEIRFATLTAPAGAVTLGAGGSTVDLTSTLELANDKGIRTARIPLACLSGKPIDRLVIRAEAPVALRLAGLTITPEPGPSSCQGPF